MRKAGYYFVKLSEAVDEDHSSETVHGGWEVAFWDPEEGWYSIWDGGSYKDEDMIEINETKLEPPT